MFKRAERFLVGGVDSPVRSFRGVDRSNPLFISKARGSKIYDLDGNEYIDYVCSWGASILGSVNPSVIKSVFRASKNGLSFGAATEQEVDLAARIQKHVPSMELMRFVCSGTEATMSAIRVARAFTKKDKVLKFDGCYHGHADSFLVGGGSGLATFSLPDSAGVPESISSQTLVASFNNIESSRNLLESNRGKVAAIIVEPIAGNMGVIPPRSDFLKSLRKLSDEYGAVLIFDEVITGFRVSIGGAQALYGVQPDLTCLGKVIGGGMNVAAYGGKSEMMRLVSPLGPVYQAGTLAGNPVAVAAGLATLGQLNASTYLNLDRASERLSEGLKRKARDSNVNLLTQRVGSMIGIFFDPKSDGVNNHEDVKNCNKAAYARFFGSMLEQGIYLPPSAFETIFVSTAHSKQDIDTTLEASEDALESVSKGKTVSQDKIRDVP